MLVYDGMLIVSLKINKIKGFNKYIKSKINIALPHTLREC